MSKYGKYTWEGYNIKGECVCGGYVYASNEDDAREEIEKEIENNYEDYVAEGYCYDRLVGFEPV